MQKLRDKTGARERRERPSSDYWDAVRARDGRFDGAFYYSVSTTGVYCRPSCAARLARREHVAFHASCADAEAAGFRPCKRCKPNEPALRAQHAATIARACRMIEEAEELLPLDALAAAAGLSPHHFHRVFKSIVGVTPKAFAVALRQKRLHKNLASARSVTEAVHASGFNSAGRLYAKSKDYLGMTPTEFRSGGSGATLRFAVGQCSLGSVLVAASEKGVVAIFLGDDPELLIADLQRRFPRATLASGDKPFEDIVAKVVGLVDAPRRDVELPLDIRGTAFQHQVWQALRDIPAGTTATYSEIAERIGSPRAVRAVAAACAANKIAVAIPCHRVVRSDGSLSGYRWGVERKRRLIASEGDA